MNIKLNKNKGDLSKSWRVLKDIIGSKKESTKINKFCFGNREIIEEFEIANLFNNYFVNIGPTLEKKIANNNASPLHYLPDRKVE